MDGCKYFLTCLGRRFTAWANKAVSFKKGTALSAQAYSMNKVSNCVAFISIYLTAQQKLISPER